MYVSCSWRGAVIKVDEDTDTKKKEVLPEAEDSSVGLCFCFFTSCCKYIYIFLSAEVQYLFTVEHFPVMFFSFC